MFRLFGTVGMSIEQNAVQLMERACTLLLAQFKLPAEERGRSLVEYVAPELVIGESTGPAPLGK